MKVYLSPKVRDRIEASTKFAGQTPMNAEVDETMATSSLKAIARRISKQLAHRDKRIVGVSITNIEFAAILDPDETFNESWRR